MVSYVFPGQGSQHRGMGRKLFDAFPDLVRTTDEILGRSIRELCLDDPEGLLQRTDHTQPALYVVNALTYRQLVAERGRPDIVAGHSLGEYNALLAAGVFDFATGLRLVRKRGELMAGARDGGMAAVLGRSEKEVRDLLKQGGFDSIDVANLNAPAQIVVSGPRADIERAAAAFTGDSSTRYVVLKVSGAFHSRYMADAEREFAAFLDGFTLQPPTIPVVANVTARRYRRDEIAETLVAQMTSAVKWSETVRYLLGRGEQEIVEAGPGRVLTGLIAQIRKDAEPLFVDDDEEDRPAAAAEVVVTPGGELGDAGFRQDYGLRYAGVAGALSHGISSRELVTEARAAGLLAVLGTQGRTAAEVEDDVRHLAAQPGTAAWGVNVTPAGEDTVVEVCLRHGAGVVEAYGYTTITPALVRYRLTGARRDAAGRVVPAHRIIAKVSRPEVAKAFLSPAPAKLVAALTEAGQLTAAEAALAGELPMAEDLCCAADSGGHTDQAVALTLFPSLLRLRDRLVAEHGYARPVRLGAAGGIGTPEAAAAVFTLGADFVLTGSINLCTVESGASDLVKDMIQDIDVQDTGYAPAGEGFEYGGRVQVLRKGVLFPPRAAKLHELYKRHDSLDELDPATAAQIQERYFKKTFEQVWTEVRAQQPAAEIERAGREPRHRMALVFRWYLDHSLREALAGTEDNRVDFQVHCGSALGAFNQWVKGTELAGWRERRVGDVNRRLFDGAAALLAGARP